MNENCHKCQEKDMILHRSYFVAAGEVLESKWCYKCKLSFPHKSALDLEIQKNKK